MENEMYMFVGEGAGVPGLPHIITITQALELGVIEILKGAIANGNYVEVNDRETLSAPPSTEQSSKKRRQ
jgi:hypothetical protein